MESIRNNFFIGADVEKKITCFAWNQVLASKEKGGLGVLSFYALNRALLLKWVWRFVSQDGSLWYHVIQAIYEVKINSHPVRYSSNWCSILREMNSLKVKGLYFMSFCSKRIGNGNSTNFWLDIWKGDSAFCELFPRVYALESVKDISVASKMAMQMDSIYFRDLHVEECNGVECCSLFVMSTSWCAYADIGVVKLLLDYFGKLSKVINWSGFCGMLHGLVINWSSSAIETSRNRVNGELHENIGVREVARTARIALEFAPEFVYWTSLCYDDIHDVTPRVSALAECDIFTKGLPSTLFDEFRSSLSVRSPSAQTAREC
ncbi:hypothetical protein Tco_1564085 [Tanacetum coccineum]